MSFEIPENPDFEYLEKYLKDSIRKDFTALLKSGGKKNSLKYINDHFELYNSAIKKLKDNIALMQDEISLLRRAADMQSVLIKAICEEIQNNADEIKRMKKKTFFGLF